MAVLGRGSTSLMSRPRADLPLLPLRLITDEPFLFTAAASLLALMIVPVSDPQRPRYKTRKIYSMVSRNVGTH